MIDDNFIFFGLA